MTQQEALRHDFCNVQHTLQMTKCVSVFTSNRHQALFYKQTEGNFTQGQPLHHTNRFLWFHLRSTPHVRSYTASAFSSVKCTSVPFFCYRGTTV